MKGEVEVISVENVEGGCVVEIGFKYANLSGVSLHDGFQTATCSLA